MSLPLTLVVSSADNDSCQSENIEHTYTTRTSLVQIARSMKIYLVTGDKKIMDRKAMVDSDDVSDVGSLITNQDKEIDDIFSDANVLTATKPFLDAPATTIRVIDKR